MAVLERTRAKQSPVLKDHGPSAALHQRFAYTYHMNQMNSKHSKHINDQLYTDQ